MCDEEKEAKAFINKNGTAGNNGKMNNLYADPQSAVNRQIQQLRRFIYGLAALLALTFLILVVTFSIFFANLKWDIENHDHPPKIGAQMNKVLEKEELCLLCNEVRLGPSVEEDQTLDYFVRKPGLNGKKDEECCVETPSQLLKLLQLVRPQYLCI